MSKYLILFTQSLNESKTHQEALQIALSQYLLDMFPNTYDALSDQERSIKAELQRFIEHTKTAVIGNIVIDYPFSIEITDLKDLFTIARLTEISAYNAPSKLVSDCENTAALKGHNPAAIYAQVALLESALVKGEVDEHHKLEVETKIKVWIVLLYEKFADLILKSSRLATLKKAVKKSFDSTVCKDLPQLSEFHHEMECQLEFLQNKGFFTKFYAKKTLADKYDYTYDFYQKVKALGAMEPTLKATLTKVFYQAVNKAYDPCETEKFKKMHEKGATIEEVFGALKEWKKKQWKKYEASDLLIALDQRLLADEENYDIWQKVSFKLGSNKSAKPPMFQLHAMKYAGNPKDDPKTLLKSLASLPSPVKAKRPVLSENAAPILSTAQVGSAKSRLACDEESLDELEDVVIRSGATPF